MTAVDMPWLAEARQRLPSAVPGALLIHGSPGLGKTLLAVELAQQLLCETVGFPGESCGTCPACRLFLAGTHPDFRLVEPESSSETDADAAAAAPAAKTKRKSTQISVTMVRDLADLLARTPYRGQARVVIVSPAEAMHISAANALLKMLEEPPAQTHFILVSHHAHRLLATIMSRCFKLPVQPPEPASALQWMAPHVKGQRALLSLALAMAGYSPIAGLRLLEDADYWNLRNTLVQRLSERGSAWALAESAEAMEPLQIGQILTMWVYDLLSARCGLRPRYHSDYEANIRGIAARIDLPTLRRWHDQVLAYVRAAHHPLNRRLALEGLFAGYPDVGANA